MKGERDPEDGAENECSFNKVRHRHTLTFNMAWVFLTAFLILKQCNFGRERQHRRPCIGITHDNVRDFDGLGPLSTMSIVCC
jgi:hypothetical protein